MKVNLRIALPSKGLLSGEAISRFEAAGYTCGNPRMKLHFLDGRNGVEFVYLRSRDIARFVEEGIVQAGVSGQDFVAEAEVDVYEALALDFAHSSVRYAVDRDEVRPLESLLSGRIATAMPNMVAADLRRRGCSGEVVPMEGAVENAVHLGIANVVCDIVASGKTLRENGLRAVGEPLIASQAVLVAARAAAWNPHLLDLADRLARVAPMFAAGPVRRSPSEAPVQGRETNVLNV